MMINKRLVFWVLFAVVVIGAVSFYIPNQKQTLSAPTFYVANAGDGTISEVNVQNNTPVRSIDLDNEQLSHGIAESPDGKLVYFGTGFQGKSLRALDAQTNEVIKEINFDEGIHGIDIHPSGKYLYVSLMSGLGEKGGVLAVIDTEQFKEIAQITTDDGPAHVSVSKDGAQIWVANVNGNTVSAIDAYTFQVIATINVGEVPNEVALSPKQDYAFVANVKSNSLSVIDMLTFEVVTELEVGEGVHGVTVSPDGKQVWTANNNSNDVSIIDTSSLSVVKTIETGSYPNHISFSPDGTAAFVTHREGNNLVMINTNDYKIVQTIELGKEPHEMTLKGMELVTIDTDDKKGETVLKPWLEPYFLEKEVFAEGVEVKARLLSPYNEEDLSLVLNNIEIDPGDYFILNVEMTTHSGDLSTIPFKDRITLVSNEGLEQKVIEWIVIGKDSHHPQNLALFEKTVDKKPILKNLATTLTVRFQPFITNESIEIKLGD